MNRFLLYAALLLLTQCSKCKTDDPRPTTELEKLPPATQTGANTFGCLVNGQAFTPRGSFSSAGLVVSYDPTFQGGTLEIRVTRLDGTRTRQHLLLGGVPIAAVGSYANSWCHYFDDLKSAPCHEYYSSPSLYRRGTVTVTRLDLQARIIAGTFEFVLAQPGCDTVKVTNGRFDKFLQ